MRYLFRPPDEPGVYRVRFVGSDGDWFVAAIPSEGPTWFEGPRRRSVEEAAKDLDAEQRLRAWLRETAAAG